MVKTINLFFTFSTFFSFSRYFIFLFFHEHLLNFFFLAYLSRTLHLLVVLSSLFFILKLLVLLLIAISYAFLKLLLLFFESTFFFHPLTFLFAFFLKLTSAFIIRPSFFFPLLSVVFLVYFFLIILFIFLKFKSWVLTVEWFSVIKGRKRSIFHYSQQQFPFHKPKAPINFFLFRNERVWIRQSHLIRSCANR